jgi:septal ring factor EnvC (AmiA/AmiB activator)
MPIDGTITVRTMRRITLYLCVSVTLVGCTKPAPPPKPTPQPTNLSGQVFIATEGGISYKLALVKVYAIDESDILHAAHTSIPLIQADIQTEKSQHDEFQSAIAKDKSTIADLSQAIESDKTKLVQTQALHDASQIKIKSLNDKALHDLDALMNKVQTLANTPASMPNTTKVEVDQVSNAEADLTKSTDAAQSEVTTLNNVVKSTEKDINDISNDLKIKSDSLTSTEDDLKKQEDGATSDKITFDHSNNSASQFTKLLNVNSALAEADTDADGHFDITIPPEHKAYLVASAQRKVADGTEEHYFWIVLVGADTKASLNNSNLTTSTDIVSRFGPN